MSVTFGLKVLVKFLSDHCFVLRYTYFLLQNISSVCHCRLSPFVVMGCMHSAQMKGGGGHMGGKESFADIHVKI